MIVYIAENAPEITARKHGLGERDMANWFVVEGGTSIVHTEITLEMAVERLLAAGRLVYRIDTDGGHLQQVTEVPHAV